MSASMCTVIIATGLSADWPLLLAANRDERLDRPWLPPAAHWPDRPAVIGGLDTPAGGTWLAARRGLAGRGPMVAAVLNRTGTLGPAPGKRSRGELPLLSLRHPDAAAAARAISALDGTAWRSFNLVIADRDGAWCLAGPGCGSIAVRQLAPGLHMVAAGDPDDPASPRIARHLPRFRAAALPAPPDWSAWTALLADGAPPLEAALAVPPTRGFGTVTSTLVALGRTEHYLATGGPPGSSAFRQAAGW